MDSWLVKLQCSLDDGRLLRGVKRLLVGVSGGPDSVALLCLLADLRDTPGREALPVLYAGHVHHGLRGREADLDEELVKQIARARGVECIVVRGDAAALASHRRLSREAAARALRYDAFRTWTSELALDAIALAHHLDDQAETVLFRAARGAGVRGLAGIPRERMLGRAGVRTRIIRPLLGWRRSELLEYLAARGQAFRVDASNEDRSIPRNCIRHDVLPLLERGVHPGAVEGLARLGETARGLARDLEALGMRALEESRVASGSDDVLLSVESLRRWPPSVVHEALSLAIVAAAPESGLVLESRASRSIARWLSVGGPSEARLDLGGGAQGGERLCAELRYGLLRIGKLKEAPRAPPEGDDAPLSVPGGASWRGWEITAEPRDASGAPHRASGSLEEEVDEDRVASQGALRIRSRRDGDRLWPLGAPGPKKLKELFREERVRPRERDGVPLVACGERGKDIVWVVGHRIGHPFRVTPETRRVIVLRARRV